MGGVDGSERGPGEVPDGDAVFVGRGVGTVTEVGDLDGEVAADVAVERVAVGVGLLDAVKGDGVGLDYVARGVLDVDAERALGLGEGKAVVEGEGAYAAGEDGRDELAQLVGAAVEGGSQCACRTDEGEQGVGVGAVGAAEDDGVLGCPACGIGVGAVGV